MSCKVWSRLKVTRKDGSEVKLRFQDMPWEQNKNDILDFCAKYFIKDEAFHKAAGIYKNEEAVAEYKTIISNYYDISPIHITVCCLDDDSKTIDILGLSMICEFKDQSGKEDAFKTLEKKTKEMQNFFHIIELNSDIKIKDYQSYFEGRGIIVRPDQRGLGMASEFVRLRKEICIDRNIDMTCAWMTSIGTQKAAEKHKWKTFYELPVEELEKASGLVFDVNVSIFKLMYTTRN
ncbi:putative acetyltransferase [Danaus plexippus plexippus]|uniref:Acetyltransferase n=1 Tax=Danaus plexippus plexippus TaxID=278856 RepID=A0A212FDX1_DANPL|nr:uncharacterized protein LOC116776643 [Danaus plexippus plexippus]OWR51949.1 putative acetyltransferase [Danaus plexippus plexippus]